jgi:hypothetical protein
MTKLADVERGAMRPLSTGVLELTMMRRRRSLGQPGLGKRRVAPVTDSNAPPQQLSQETALDMQLGRL